MRASSPKAQTSAWPWTRMQRSTTILPCSSVSGSERSSGEGALPIAAITVSASMDGPLPVSRPAGVAVVTPVLRRMSMPRRRSCPVA